MVLNKDLREFVGLLNEKGVKYIYSILKIKNEHQV